MIKCDFCGKDARDVELTIAGEESLAHICNECVDICVEQVEEHKRKKESK